VGTNLLTDLTKLKTLREPTDVFRVHPIQSTLLWPRQLNCSKLTSFRRHGVSPQSFCFYFSPFLSFSLSLFLSHTHTHTQQLHNSLQLLSSLNIIYTLKLLSLISRRQMEANFNTQDHGRSLWMINFNLRSFHPPVNDFVCHCLPLFTTGEYAEETKK
jgi:hypothetical protein